MAQQPALDFLKDLKQPQKKKLKKVSKPKEKNVFVDEVKIPESKYKVDKTKKPKILLVIDFQTNWYKMFKNAALEDGTPIQVEQTLWT